MDTLIIPLVLSGAFTTLGLAMLLFGGAMARLIAALADVVFEFPKTKWPQMKPIIEFVFRNPASAWIVRAVGLVIALSCGLMFVVVFLLRP